MFIFIRFTKIYTYQGALSWDSESGPRHMIQCNMFIEIAGTDEYTLAELTPILFLLFRSGGLRFVLNYIHKGCSPGYQLFI